MLVATPKANLISHEASEIKGKILIPLSFQDRDDAVSTLYISNCCSNMQCSIC